MKHLRMVQGELEREQSGPTATVDLAQTQPHPLVSPEFSQVAFEQYRRLAVTLISSGTARYKKLLVISAQRAEGRTSVLLNLAAALARTKRRVLVIDTDLVRPSTLRLLQMDVEVGLAEGLARGLAPSEMTVQLVPLGFSLLATRAPIENSIEVLGSSGLRALLEKLEPEFDFILFDSPPLRDSPDAQMLLHLVDKALLVIRPGINSSAQMAKALEMFRKEDLIGVVMNRAVGPSADR